MFGIIQPGLTSAIASAIASWNFLTNGGFFQHWLQSWLLAWVLMMPIVLATAPAIRKLAHYLTEPELS